MLTIKLSGTYQYLFRLCGEIIYKIRRLLKYTVSGKMFLKYSNLRAIKFDLKLDISNNLVVGHISNEFVCDLTKIISVSD